MPPHPPAATQGRTAGIREVARQAGVSIATVSRVFNAEGAVQEETRQRVLECAAALGYAPSPLGRNLVTGRSFLLGLIVPNISFPLYGLIMNGAEDYLAGQGLRVLLASSHDDPATEQEAATQLLRYAVDGGIVINSLGIELPPPRHSPWVHVSPETPGLPHRVELDNEAGGRLAAGELLRGGARHLAYVAAYGRESADRERGFAAAVHERGLTYRRAAGDYTVASGERAAAELLAGGSLDGVFVAGDLMAAGVLRALHGHGRQVPGDVAVVGFDDTLVAGLLYPPLTSVRQPAYDMGAAAAALALGLIVGERGPPALLAPELIRRQSTRPPIS